MASAINVLEQGPPNPSLWTESGVQKKPSRCGTSCSVPQPPFFLPTLPTASYLQLLPPGNQGAEPSGAIGSGSAPGARLGEDQGRGKKAATQNGKQLTWTTLSGMQRAAVWRLSQSQRLQLLCPLYLSLQLSLSLLYTGVWPTLPSIRTHSRAHLICTIKEGARKKPKQN